MRLIHSKGSQRRTNSTRKGCRGTEGWGNGGDCGRLSQQEGWTWEKPREKQSEGRVEHRWHEKWGASPRIKVKCRQGDGRAEGRGWDRYRKMPYKIHKLESQLKHGT